MSSSQELREREQRDLITQLNRTIANQNTLIESLQKDRE